ncbi:SH3 and cysteine-rich domain-containing protein 3-like [Rhagoletis pomonella]|uniref:SH3 and cysteine-rich domain-containing protein 3-like n=1 Tax=Rhagoletis pomonella TaxID=28610 RepID=UPI001781E945|nr:SH3 and cysteine-rich domain-containing protein 3-like [Rhagoletis pomonella]
MKNINIDYHGDYGEPSSSEYYGGFDAATSGRSKNDKNWENWERIREQKLEKMKNICFESYRQSKRDRMQQAKPKPKQLDPSWYTDNIYSNRSEDLEEDYVTVIDTSDPDWWQGKLLGRVGYFPSKYCVRLNANEKPLQVTHNLQVSDGERGENMTLLRDQIVIQTGDEVNGMVMVRSADNRQGYCPVKYLQEV